ncbi:MAG: hypothetical protein GDA67_16720 [Nitrospira sp. CR1.3]|nr:hypothetical protein [Nitrospira sp. CR1.3]
MHSEAMIRGTGLLECGRAYAFLMESTKVSRLSTLSGVTLTHRDQAMLHALTHCVKVFSIGQIHQAWWAGSQGLGDLSRRLRLLEKVGWVTRMCMACCGSRSTGSLLISWQPGEPEPGWGAILQKVHQGFDRTLRSVSGIVATPLAANHFGGQARYPRPSEWTHDLLVSSVYLSMQRNRPDDAMAWCGEGKLAQRWHSSELVLPDALIERALPPIVIEIVGQSYTPTKLRKMHEYCRIRGWRYELW